MQPVVELMYSLKMRRITITDEGRRWPTMYSLRITVADVVSCWCRRSFQNHKDLLRSENLLNRLRQGQRTCGGIRRHLPGCLREMSFGWSCCPPLPIR